MPTFRPDINPSLLQWARLRAGLDLEEFTGQLSQFPNWEEGSAKPTMRQLEAIAKKTRTPFGYFFLQSPPEESLPIPDYRTMDSGSVRRPSVDLLDTIYEMQRRQDWLRGYLIEEGEAPLAYVASASLNEHPLQFAQKIREDLGIKEDWAYGVPSNVESRKLLKEAAESAGIVVVINGVVSNNTSRKLNPDEFRGFVLSDEYAPLIFVNGSDSKLAQTFTIAHEMCHIWLGQDGIPDVDGLVKSTEPIEKLCNMVAAELTVPLSIISMEWISASNQPNPFIFLSKKFKVSPIVVGRRAAEAGLCSTDDFMSFYKSYVGHLDSGTKNDNNISGGGDFFKNQGYRVGERFFTTVATAVKRGRLMYRDAYRLTGLKSGTFENYASTLGFAL